MSDNKLKILQRLQAGEISAEEALSLMNQTGEHTAPPDVYHHEPGQADPRQINPNQQHQSYDDGHDDYDSYEHHSTHDWVENLTGWVGEVVEDIVGGIQDMDIDVNISDFFGGTYGRNKKSETFTSNPVLQGLAQLSLYGKNEKIEIAAYEGDRVQIHCVYDARRPEGYVQFHEENGCISLQFDEKAMRYVRVICQVPRVHIGQIHAATKNAHIRLADIVAGDVRVATKNAGILLESVTCKELTANTKNDSIRAKGISGSNIQLETTNAKIVTEDIHAANLNLKTTNAGIKTAYLDVAHLTMKTTNTGLKLEDTLMGGPAFWDSERTVDAHTTNSNIKFYLPGGIGLNIEAGTTDGKVTCDLPLYQAVESTKTYLKGESMDYTSSSRKLKARLSTTNASIKIRSNEG